MNNNEFFNGAMVGIVHTIIGHPFDTLKTNLQNNIKLRNINYKYLFNGITYPLISTVTISGFVFDINEVFYKKLNNHYYSGLLSGLITSPIINYIDFCKVNRQLNKKIMYSNIFKGLSASSVRESIGVSIYFGMYDQLNSNKIHPFFAGGVAGVSSWLFSYPFDTIKTRLQSGDYNNWKNCILKGNLFSGLNIAIFRAFLVNSISFWIYENLKNEKKNIS